MEDLIETRAVAQEWQIFARVGQSRSENLDLLEAPCAHQRAGLCQVVGVKGLAAGTIIVSPKPDVRIFCAVEVDHGQAARPQHPVDLADGSDWIGHETKCRYERDDVHRL